MDEVLEFLAINTVAALTLAAVVYGVARVWRNPPVVHVLWLLVLLKLMAPPVLRIDWMAMLWPASTTTTGRTIVGSSPMPLATGDSRQAGVALATGDSRQAGIAMATGDARQAGVAMATVRPPNPGALASAVQPGEPVDTQRATLRSLRVSVVGRLALLWNRARRFVFWSWIAGMGLSAAITLTRIVRFQRRLRETLPASERLQRLAREFAGRIGVARLPDIRYVDSAGGPLLWCVARRPVIALPIGLFRRLDDQQASMILVHELAHLGRRDHWIRGIELAVSTVYWWNPLAWMVRRRMHQAEEQCCDAWVRWAFPDGAKRYAEVVLLAADSMDATTVHPILATPLLRPQSLKARIEMILQSRFAPRISRRARFVVGLLALIALPAFAQSTKSQDQNRPDVLKQAGADRPAPPPVSSNKPASPNVAALSLQASLAQKFAHVPDTPPPSDFPHVVRFQQGASKLLKGDKIDITGVRGTAETMAPGNLYWITGTYALASHDRATLMVGVTAASGGGRGQTLQVQTAAVKKGAGRFTLLYAMTGDGWPHVSFYPAEGGGDFGGTYFGTGNFVLEHWWGEGPARNQQNAKAETAPPKSSTFEFPYAVPFALGEIRFLNGDKITISEVRGTSERILPDNIYWIRGTYTLASHDRAMLLVSVTAANAADGTGSGFKAQTVIANKGSGTFTLFLPMSYKGRPHVSFYPAEGGDGFGGIYFGTGESLPHPSPKLLPAEDIQSQRLWDTLGLLFHNNVLKTPQLRDLKYEGGLLVRDVRPDSPAGRSSMQKGDILVGADRYQVLRMADIAWVLDHRSDSYQDPSKLRLLIVRAGEPIPVDLTLTPER